MSGNYSQLYQQAGHAQNVDPRLLAAIGQVESGGNPAAQNPSGAEGLMQIMPATAQSLHVNPLVPQQAVQGAATLLAQNLARYKNPDEAVAAYFGGTNQANWGPKTQAYVQKVANAYQAQTKKQATNMPENQQDPDSIINAFVGAGSPAPASQSAPATDASDPDAIINAFVSGPGANNAAPPANSPPKMPGTLQQIGAGVERGLHVMTDLPAEALASGVGAAAHAVGLAPNWHPGQATAAADAQAAQAYQQNYGNAPVLSPANIADVGAQGVVGAAQLAGGEGLANAAADGVKALATGTAAEPIVNAAQNAVRFVTGRSGGGIVGRAASLAAQGGAQSAGFDVISGRPVTPTSIAAGAVLNPLTHGAVSVAAKPVAAVINASTPAPVAAARTALAAHMADAGGPVSFAPGDTLATAGGPNVQGLAEGLANKPGPGRNTIVNYFDGLTKQQPQVLAQAIRGAMGSDGTVHDLVQNVMQQRSQQAAPLFDKAFQQPVTPEATEKLQNMLDAPRGQQAVATALTNLKDAAEAQGRTFDPAQYGIQVGQDGKVMLEPDGNSMPFLHAVKEGFDDNIEGKRNEFGQLPRTKEVINLDAIRSNFRNALVEANPTYGQALASWSGPSRAIDAARLGTKVLSTDSDLTAQRIAGMDPSEKSAFQAGVAQAVLNKVGSVQDGGKIARMFATPNVRAKVAAAFNSPEEADQFMSLAEQLNNQANAKNAILGNSRTALRTAQQAHDWTATARDVAANTLTGRPHYAALDLLKGIISHQQKAGNPETDAALANLLTNPNADQVNQYLANAIPGRVSGALRKAGNVITGTIPLGGQLGLTPQRGATSGGGMGG